jgi:hypothetical protein
MLTGIIIFTLVFLIAAALASTYGTNTIQTLGRRLQVSADGVPRWKAGGITIDWSTVTPVTEDTTLTYDGTVVKNGDSYIRGGTTLTQITIGGKYGPADTGASDGREVVTAAVRGKSFILNETVVKSEPGSDHPAVFDGGRVFKGRLVYGGSGEPTEANLETMFPAITFVADAG